MTTKRFHKSLLNFKFYTFNPTAVKSSQAAISVPPVATRSSITNTRAPGDMAVLDMQSSSPPCSLSPTYSLWYWDPETEFGSLPFYDKYMYFCYSVKRFNLWNIACSILITFLIITNGFFKANAMGGPRMKPRASKPAITSTFKFWYRLTKISIHDWNILINECQKEILFISMNQGMKS